MEISLIKLVQMYKIILIMYDFIFIKKFFILLSINLYIRLAVCPWWMDMDIDEKCLSGTNGYGHF